MHQEAASNVWARVCSRKEVTLIIFLPVKMVIGLLHSRTMSLLLISCLMPALTGLSVAMLRFPLALKVRNICMIVPVGSLNVTYRLLIPQGQPVPPGEVICILMPRSLLLVFMAS